MFYTFGGPLIHEAPEFWGFCTPLHSVHLLRLEHLQHFGEWMCLHLQQAGEKGEPNLVGPLIDRG
jgi:hypothetical protein